MSARPLLLALLLALLLSPLVAGAATYRLAATLPTGVGPSALSVSPDGGKLVVANSDSADLSVFSLPDLSATGKIDVGRVPLAMTFDAQGSLFVACFRENAVYKVRLDRGEAVGHVAVGKGPRAIAIAPSGRVFVPTYYDGGLEVIDAAGPSLAKTVPLDVGVSQVSIVPGQNRALVLNTSSDRIHVVDTREEAQVGLIDDKIGTGLWEQLLDPTGQRLVVTGWVSNSVAIVDATQSMTYALIPTDGKGAAQMALSPDGRIAYVAHSESDTLVAVDLAAEHQAGSVKVGRFPFSDVAVSPDGADVLVTNDKDGTVSIVDAASMTVRQTLEVGSIPRRILFVGRRALISCAFSNHLAVLEPVDSPRPPTAKRRARP